MKIGINLLLWTTEVTRDHLPLLATIKAAEYNGVEIPLANYTDALCGILTRELDTLKLQRTASTMLGADENPISTDKRIRDNAWRKIASDIMLCQAIGATKLVGPVHSAHKVFTGRGPTEQEREHAVAFIQYMDEQAGAADIEVAVEFLNRFECYLLNTAADTQALINAAKATHVGVLYDTHHANIEESDVQQAIKTTPSINHVHISESHRGTPGSGQVNWAQTFQALAERDYDDWLTVEAFSTADAGLASAANVWRNNFESPEQLLVDGINFIHAQWEHANAAT